MTASLVGTSIEFYDFYVYATAASLVFPALFFPSDDHVTALLASFAVFGVAFIARPIGSILFGHFGDRIGRKGTLVGTLLVMGIATFIIGLLPTAANHDGSVNESMTVIAPLLLVVMRFCQGLGLGGEWSGAALLATENAPANKRAIYGTFPQLGAPIGFILGNLLFVILNFTLTEEQFMTWGWRIPFLLSAVLVVLGLWVRIQLTETPAFQKVQREKHVVKAPLVEVFKHSWKAIILGTFVMLATYVLFYMMTAFMLTYGSTPTTEQAAAAAAESGEAFDAASYVGGLGYPKTDFLIMLIIAVLFFAAFTLVSGPLAERFGRKKMLLGVTALIFAFGFAMTPILDLGHVGVQLQLILGMTLMGLTFGPMGAVLPEYFPANTRYTGSAIAYNLSSVIGAGIAPSVFVALWSVGEGSPVWVGVYLAGAAVLTIVALLFSKETKGYDYANTSRAD
ncbi:MFS transporter [Gulosibacter sp. 10]|uniref:MFS transporter n=1 Tax=Gulosibacter sp. 10 TaxID=1255570 RepID=UPI0020CE949C|nr:MFS transporter [Gulosibacter sp. 10]